MVQLLLLDAGNFFLAMIKNILMWRPMWFWVKVMWVLPKSISYVKSLKY